MDELDLLLKKTSRSLYLSARILPKKMRLAFSVAYLLCRYADTIADTPILPAERRKFWVDNFPKLVQTQDRTLVEQITKEVKGPIDNPYERELAKNLPLCLDAYNQVAADLQPFILEVVRNVCEGMKLDLAAFPNRYGADPVPFSNREQLTQYCRFMGGRPGLFWSQLITHQYRIKTDNTTFFELGENIGDALQIVNIVRDTPRDLSFGRCYFPKDELALVHLLPEELTNPQNSTFFEPIKRTWIRWGKQNLLSAKDYFAAIPKTAFAVRAAVAWPVLWTADNYVALLNEKEILNPDRRVKIPRYVIYLTMLCTPLILLSNALFDLWLTHKLNKIP